MGDFELLARLGRGGQGEVFLARPWQPSAARRVAARQWLRLRLAAGALSPAEVLRWGLAALKLAHPTEADSLHDMHGHLAAHAAHPHLPLLYSRRFPGLARDFGLAPAAPAGRPWLPYLATVYVPGQTLECALRLPQPPDPGWAVSIAIQLADALAHLHRGGVVHHDVRAANIVVRRRPGGEPHSTLIDLGAAETPAAPRRRAVYGVADHLPPERLSACPAPPTPHVDIYGLGILLRQLTAATPRSPALCALLADATAADPGRRHAALPDMGALAARLVALPEARTRRVKRS